MKITTYWYNRKDNWKPTKRYILIFNTFTDSKVISISISQYDNWKDCMDESVELDSMYKTHKLPIEKKEFFIGASKKNRMNKSERIKTIYDFSDNRSWWGYIILDMHDCKCLKVGGYGFRFYVSKRISTSESINVIKNTKHINNSVYILDYFFRDTNVCPDEYEFDGIEEYEGWIQYRWGDGKNAINYVKPPKTKSINKKIVSEIDGYDIETGGLDDYFKYESLENKFSDLINKETYKRLMEKYN